jgi:hypothetical protein
MDNQPAGKGEAGHIAGIRPGGLYGSLHNLGNGLRSGFMPAHARRDLLVLVEQPVIRTTLDIINPILCKFKIMAANSILLEKLSADQEKPNHGEQEEYAKEWGPGHRWSQSRIEVHHQSDPICQDSHITNCSA